MTNVEKISCYTIKINPAPSIIAGYEATYVELRRSICGYGLTALEALKDLETIAKLFLEDMEIAGESLPDRGLF